MSERKKIYAHRNSGWKYDLPDCNERPDKREFTATWKALPNSIGRTYFEIARRSIKVRGISVIGGTLVFVHLATEVLPAILNSLARGWHAGIDTTIFGIMIISAAVWAFFPLFRMDLRLPREEPIRFNRARQKVYFYEYRYDRLYPFGSKGWGVKPVVYDWADLTAEVYRVYAPMGGGGLIENVMISVCKPGTEEVIDRLFLCDNIEQGKQYWALARLYMQSGYDALPDSVRPVQGQKVGTNLNPVRYFAPKVQWPAEIDFESRSAPATDEYI
ncbi:DUF6708 domain-containing protein [Pseudomonas sp. NPDC089392]|uniref:DUF6708 domain-containing protein n=1 Tax=Pseudomonas sp. NPDC089392 TaxID=3364459 RepID=UPI0037F8DED8